MCFVESEIAYASLPFSPSPLPLRVFQEDPAAAHEAVHGHRQGPPAESEEEKDGRTDGRKHWALRPQKPLRLLRDGEVGGGEGVRDFISNTYSLYCQHQNDSALRWAVA